VKLLSRRQPSSFTSARQTLQRLVRKELSYSGQITILASIKCKNRRRSSFISIVAFISLDCYTGFISQENAHGHNDHQDERTACAVGTGRCDRT